MAIMAHNRTKHRFSDTKRESVAADCAKDDHLVDLELRHTVLQDRYDRLNTMWQALVEYRRKLKAGHDALPVGVITLNDKGQIVDWNGMAAKMLKRKRQDPQRQPFTMFIHSGDTEVFLKHLARCLRMKFQPSGHEQTVCEVRLKESGTPVQLSSALIRTEEGNFYQTALVDLTDRKKAEQAIEDEKKFSDTIVETIREPLAVLNSELMIVRTNQAFARLFKDQPLSDNTSLEALMNLWWSGNELRVHLERALYRNVPLNDFEMEVSVRGAGRRIFLFNARRLRVKKDSPMLLLVALEDITERKQAQINLAVSNQQLKALNNELERRVEERTKELRESNQQLEGFCYSIAHDLRAPLRAMAYFSDSLAQKHAANLNAEGKHCAQRIAAASRRMDSLIHDLLEFGRFSTAQFAASVVHPDAVLDVVILESRPEIEQAGARIERRGLLSPVLAHPVILHTGFANLIGNALKFVAPGVSPRITIWEERFANHVRIWVADNGIGISPEHQQKIFNAFERLHSTRDYPGNGIGLATVSKALHRIGGRVGVESKPRKGSRFWMEIPRADKVTP